MWLPGISAKATENYLFNNSEINGLKAYGLVFTFLFWLHGKYFSHVNISKAAINWVDIVVHSPFRTFCMQPVINIQKGNWILKNNKIFHGVGWTLIGLLVLL